MKAWIAAGWSLLFGLGASVGMASVGQERLNDACLRSVYFVDAQEGWAVGDEGVIWHSIDGGQTWERQPTGTRASLRAVHFVNPFVGWAVGREELPNGSSLGVVLVTTNGGLKWTRLAWNTLPGLHAVHFFDEKNGIVAGASNDRYSSGVFRTQDGGQTWTIVPGERQADWLAADFRSTEKALLGGSWGRMARLSNELLRGTTTDFARKGHVYSVVQGKTRDLAVGQGGIILAAPPGSSDWKACEVIGWSRELLRTCDFRSVCAVGDHAWVVGRPGSIVVHSVDGGRSWRAQPTGQSLPLHGVFFLDERTGWAVGELGTILGTNDGGQTWKIQRRGGHRLALLAVHASPSTAPWDVFAHAGADDGYLVGAIRLFSSDPRLSPFRCSAEPHQWTQAVRRVGAATGEMIERFPLAPFDQHLSSERLWSMWDRDNPTPSTRDNMLAQIVLAIRMWQPEIVVTDEARDGPTQVVAQLVREAYRLAADESAFPEQIQRLALKPWSAHRLFVSGTSATSGPHSISQVNSEPTPRLGESAQDLADSATESVGWRLAAPATRQLACVESRTANDNPSRLFDGITLAHGGTARREQTELTADQVREVEERILLSRRCRNIELLARSEASSLSGPDKLVSQLSTLTRGLPPDTAARSVWRLGRSFAESGKWTAAQDTFDWMLEHYAAHPLSAEAARWLAAYSASAEARRRYEAQFATRQGEYQVRPASNNVPDMPPPSLPQSTDNSTIVADSKTPFLTAQKRGWHAAALPLEKRMAAFGSLYLHDPAFQFALQSARRSLGDLPAARTWMKRFVDEMPPSSPNADPWREAAAAEVWLSQRIGQPIRPTVPCFRTLQRPTLDGKLEDPCWADVPPTLLSHAVGHLDGEDSTQFRWAFDEEFIYIAVECRHAVGRQVAKVERRRRDETLDPFDRISILIDIDRDYQTYFHLQVDQRGCVRDDCWGDATWNPKWYVAHDSRDDGWTIEVAVPWSELTSETPGVGTVWACHVTRIIPGRGLQAWSWPSDVTPRPEGMGLLIFSERGRK